MIAAVRGIRGSTFNAIVISGDTSAAVHDFDGDSHLCWLRKPTNSALLLTVLQNFTSPLSPWLSRRRGATAASGRAQVSGARCHCCMHTAAKPSSMNERRVRTHPMEDAFE